MSTPVKFLNKENTDFFNVLQARVNAHFKATKRSKYGGTSLIIKSLILLSLLIGPYVIILAIQPSLWVAAILLVVMGIGKAGVGMSVMHDALHGAFSNKKWVNKLFGNSLYLLGGNPLNWKIQHNVLHHTYPNVYKIDEDISTKGFVVRLSPESHYRPIFKYQWLYVLPLYALMTLSFLVKDFRQLSRYNKMGATSQQGKVPGSEMFNLIFTKTLYLLVIIGLPIVVTSYSVLAVVVGFFIVHATAGLILSMVFQLAHVVEGIEYPTRNVSGDLDTSWAVHQLVATSNFAPKSKWVHWFTGGLNHQVEHHLFPHISHVHYRAIAPIVQKTAEEYGIPYNSEPTVTSALKSHLKMLMILGRKEELELA